MKADIVLYNGTFITMDPLLPFASALAIKDNKILWAGNQKDSKEWLGPKTQQINLNGSFGYPGFIDSHAHIVYTGVTNNALQLRGKDKQAIIKEVSDQAKKTQRGQWIYGLGWEEEKWQPKGLPTAFDLDNVSPDHPVMLSRYDTHMIWVNSYAMKLAGIDASTPDPFGGKIIKDSTGNPTGILINKAMMLVRNIVPPYSLDQNLQITKEVIKNALKNGITMIHDAAISPVEFEILKYLANENSLGIRIYMMGAIRDHGYNIFLSQSPMIYGPFLEMRCLKLFADGAFGSRGAALFESYSDDPQNYGLLHWEEKDILPILLEAKSKGYQVAMHAIGDKGNNFVLNLYEKIDTKKLRWRIEHVQLLRPSDIKRFSELNVIAAVQPLFATTDMAWFEERVGYERAKTGGYAWKSLIDQGAIVAGGSDSPVVSINPLLGIHAAITRTDLDGHPSGGWFPEQIISREDALKLYTINGAYACFREHELGSLSPGKLADIVILPENLLSCPADNMVDMPVLFTFVDGKIAYSIF